MRCAEPGCGRLLDHDHDVCTKCKRHRRRAAELARDLLGLPELSLLDTLVALPASALQELQHALRGAYTPAGRI